MFKKCKYFYFNLAKGRTNIELREQFILASGVTQAMTTFRSRPSFIGQNLDVSTGRTQGQRLSVTGPPGIKVLNTYLSKKIISNLIFLNDEIKI